jgi:alpha-amylase
MSFRFRKWVVAAWRVLIGATCSAIVGHQPESVLKYSHFIVSLICASLLSVASATRALQSQPGASGKRVAIQGTSIADGANSDVWYEIFVRSWYDTNDDGIGDLNGVTEKLDYLKALGVSGIWLMPINPSPSYHGYDVTDYYTINPQFGSMADFDRMVNEAHKRGIKVIIDLVINHTSSAHPWFKAAANPDDPHHDWYRWSTPSTDLDAISATGGPAWHALGKQHYEGTFTGEMPDLDYDTPAVWREMIRVGQFWLKKGVDGFRLDAAQHIYFDFAAQKNDAAVLQKNLAWWSAFRQGMNAVNPQAYIVGEVTRDSADALAPYFKPLSAVFDFPLASQLIASAKSEDATGLTTMLLGTDALLAASAGRHGIDAPFLSNHDQNRVMSQLRGDAGHMRVAAAMLLTLPGQPFVYYGEELGMCGVKPDPDLREPMRWERSAHGTGETTWKRSSTHDGTEVSVQAELADQGSLLHRYVTLIHWRSEISALRDGAIAAYPIADAHVAAWRLDDANSHVLVVHNLSRQTRTIALDLAGAPVFDTLEKRTSAGAVLHGRQLTLPPYGSVILR